MTSIPHGVLTSLLVAGGLCSRDAVPGQQSGARISNGAAAAFMPLPHGHARQRLILPPHAPRVDSPAPVDPPPGPHLSHHGLVSSQP